MKRDAIVLAGAKNNGALKGVSSASYEALIPLSGRPLIQYVVDALSKTVTVGRIVVVGPEEQLRPVIGEKAYAILEGCDSILENIKKGVEALQVQDMILLITSDIPLITPEAIEDFFQATLLVEGDLYYPIISKGDNESLLPEVERTYVRLKEGVYTGGNLFLFSPHALPICYEPMEKFISKRKHPLQLTRLLGPSFLLKLLLGHLSLEDIKKRMSKILGIRGVPIISHHPVMGFDIDKPSDLALGERFLKENQ